MTEKCLIAASLAALAFHPSSTIRCFKPKPDAAVPPVELQKEETPISKLHRSNLRKVLCMTKSCPGKQASVSRRRTASTLCSASGVDPYRSLDPVSEPLAGVVEAIFRSGWGKGIGVTVEKILKVNHSRDGIKSFEEYREMVKSKAKKEESGSSLRYWERLLGDGNEHLLYDGGVIGCSLGSDDEGDLSICRKKCCGVCRVISSSNLARREEEAVLMWGNSWGAHEKVASADTTPLPGSPAARRRGIVLCKVIAGRVVGAHRLMGGGGEKGGGGGGGFDSVVSTGEDQLVQELTVLNPKAILPCFVIIYSTQ